MFFIKDLKDLAMGPARFSIDIKDLKDLKRHRLTMDNARDRPSRYETRAFPRRSGDREGQALALRNAGVVFPTLRQIQHTPRDFPSPQCLKRIVNPLQRISARDELI